jgi:hypothetical protein
LYKQSSTTQRRCEHSSTFFSRNYRPHVSWVLVFRVARFFLEQHTKVGKNVHNLKPQNIPNVHIIYQIAVKYS